MSRVLIAGTNSGCGKTTAVCALLRALKLRKQAVTAYKCGPDYIDPMFHTKALDVPCHNLDGFLCADGTVRYLLAQAQGVAVVEGVMGLYDGMGFETDFASSNYIANITQTPALLTVNCKGASLSVAATVQGFLQFAPNTVQGVLLNNTSAAMYPVYRKLIEERCGVRVYGYLPTLPAAHIGSRHLGLITAQEVQDIEQKLDILGNCALETLDLDGILALAQSAPPLVFAPPDIKKVGSVRIAVAKDEAFCFYYAQNLALLERLGGTIVPFSPIADAALPQNIQGLYLGGGYPEVFGEKLAQNVAMRQCIRAAIAQGLPTIAECGGFMYLQTDLQGTNGKRYDMVGTIPASASMTDKLQRFGYATLRAKHDNLLMQEGQCVPIHEFHYSQSSDWGQDCTTTKSNGKTWDCAFATDTLFALYPHLHFWSDVRIPTRFVQKCAQVAAK